MRERVKAVTRDGGLGGAMAEFDGIRIIGIDCATDDRKVAVAVGTLSENCALVDNVRVCGGRAGRAIDVVCQTVRAGTKTLLALDAPLGWPITLGKALAEHRAGQPIVADSNHLFRRETDRIVKQIIGQQPLDVGADRIARTAHRALMLIKEIGERIGTAVNLAWAPSDIGILSAIEVYPAATLKARGIPARQYKQSEQREARRALISRITEICTLPTDTESLESCADAIDAAVCVVAGVDFLLDRCIAPTDLSTARREGWIWVARPNQNPPNSI